jgi:hypothetical protein
MVGYKIDKNVKIIDTFISTSTPQSEKVIKAIEKNFN